MTACRAALAKHVGIVDAATMPLVVMGAWCSNSNVTAYPTVIFFRSFHQRLTAGSARKLPHDRSAVLVTAGSNEGETTRLKSQRDDLLTVCARSIL